MENFEYRPSLVFIVTGLGSHEQQNKQVTFIYTTSIKKTCGFLKMTCQTHPEVNTLTIVVGTLQTGLQACQGMPVWDALPKRLSITQAPQQPPAQLPTLGVEQQHDTDFSAVLFLYGIILGSDENYADGTLAPAVCDTHIFV